MPLRVLVASRPYRDIPTSSLRIRTVRREPRHLLLPNQISNDLAFCKHVVDSAAFPMLLPKMPECWRLTNVLPCRRHPVPYALRLLAVASFCFGEVESMQIHLRARVGLQYVDDADETSGRPHATEPVLEAKRHQRLQRNDSTLARFELERGFVERA